MKKSLLILIIVLLLGCHPHYEVYKHYPKDTVLTYDMFKRSSRIFLSDSFLILQLNVLKKEDLWWDAFAKEYFLFFFNDSLKLKYACYAQGYIDSFVNKTFYISVDSIEQKSWKYEICDLPQGYKIAINKLRLISLGRVCTILDSFHIHNDQIKLFVRKTDSLLICIGYCNQIEEIKSLQKVFNRPETLHLPINSLALDYECGVFYYYDKNNAKDISIIADTNQIYEFYKMLIKNKK